MKKFTALLLVVIMVLANIQLFGCEKSEGIIIKVWAGESLIGYDEFDMAQKEWILQILFNEYEKNNPGVKIDYTYFDDEDIMYESLLSSYGTANMPDIFVFWTGEFIKGMSDMVVPLNKYLSESEINNNDFWDYVTKDGEILGYPIGGAEVNFIAYNKEILNNLKLDSKKISEGSIDNFTATLQQIYENGYNPILSNERGYNQLFSVLMEFWWQQTVGVDTVKAQCNGEKSFSSDEAFIKYVNLLQSYYKSGYINVDYATGGNAINDFCAGKGAFLPTSIYKIKLLKDALGDNLGVFTIPSADAPLKVPTLSLGGCWQCISVVNSSKNIDTCVDLIKWLMNDENGIRMAQRYRAFPVQNSISLTDLGWDTDNIYLELYPLTQNLSVTSDNYMPAEMAEKYYKYGVQTLIGLMSAQELAKNMDEWSGYAK